MKTKTNTNTKTKVLRHFWNNDDLDDATNMNISCKHLIKQSLELIDKENNEPKRSFSPNLVLIRTK